ncbi:hypothetical protein AMQ68_13020 [Chryseobacterium sp. ERMR1:04]|nr:hypothetical protein AMQ68_13020 [Chryseobacterium sp. ERMR1:04]
MLEKVVVAPKDTLVRTNVSSSTTLMYWNSMFCEMFCSGFEITLRADCNWLKFHNFDVETLPCR